MPEEQKTEEVVTEETKDVSTDKGYKELLDRIDDKDSQLAEAQRIAAEADEKRKKAEYKLRKQNEERKEMAAAVEDTPAPAFDPQAIASIVEQTLESRENAARADKLTDKLSTIADEHKRQYVQKMLSKVSISNVDDAFQAAVDLAEAEVRRMAQSTPGFDSVPTAPTAPSGSHATQTQDEKPEYLGALADKYGLATE